MSLRNPKLRPRDANGWNPVRPGQTGFRSFDAHFARRTRVAARGTRAFHAVADGSFFADATLTVKGERHPIKFTFTVTEKGPLRVLEGGARLDRHALGIGTGEWDDPTWIGQFVEVEVQVTAANF